MYGEDVQLKETIKSQYYASLEMLRIVIRECPEMLWTSTEYGNPTWQTAFHVLFYTHLYLHPHEEDFVPWEKHKDELVSLSGAEDSKSMVEPYTQEELLAYTELILQQVEEQVDRMDLKAESGFYWLPFDKLELQFYNIRHVQHHTGELSERIGAIGENEFRWVKMKPG
jgi:hypothetical protein